LTQKTIPAHLVSTYQLLQCAFPQGVEDQEYLPLLSVLYEHMSDRSLAQAIADFTGREYYLVLNDVYRLGVMAAFSAQVMDAIKQKLIHCDYEKWLLEESSPPVI
jgi:hypothetical protein